VKRMTTEEDVLEAIIELVDPEGVLQNYENLLMEIQSLMEMKKDE
tara:strand:+ start:317 stop:451 length:135 start_codon:yes stop_codon:yes gene_type:complete